MTYPSGAVINTGYDSKARLNSMPGYLNSVSYNQIGQVSGISLGNGVVESYGYDTNRMQLTSQSATKNGVPLLSLAYSYQAAVGQNGAGSTAGNTGQLMAVTCCSSIGGLAELAGYTYDNTGRLATSNQTTNGVSAQRRFAYDRFGNRTGVWDAVTGGNQIQSVALQQSGGVPTNRVASVTTVGTLNYTYDSAGNVTNDGAHIYQYDAENRVVSVDNGAATYSYDHQNRRVKKVVGGVTRHYVWEGSQVISEHSGATGAQIVRYIYAGSRMVAKVEGANTRYFISDRLSARLVLDTSGNVVGKQSHLPFGEEIGGSGEQQKQRFTSYERDAETGTDYAINRGYSPAVGRFMQADPYRASGGVNDPQSWNRYAYVNNNPINAVDPLGLFLQEIFDIACKWDLIPCDIFSNPHRDPEGRSGGGVKPPVPPVKPKLKYANFMGYVKQFFIDKPNCVTEFQKLGIYESFLETSKNARYVDFTDPENARWTYMTFEEAGLKSSRLRTLMILVGVNNYFGIAWYQEQVVTIGPKFYSQGYEDELDTVIHENLHLYFRFGDDHIRVAEELKLGQFNNHDDAGWAIDNWLRNRCERNP